MIYREELSEVGRFLVLAVRDVLSVDEQREFANLFDSLGDARCQEEARENKVEMLVATALRSVRGEALPRHWLDMVERNESRVQGLLDALGGVSTRLREAGIRAAAVESGGVLLGSRLPLSAFGSGDIDLLIEKGGLVRARVAFEKEGFVVQERRVRAVRQLELRREGPGGVLYWVGAGELPFERFWVPLHYRERAAEWLSRAQPSPRVPAIDILRTEDSLAFVSMHTSLHSYVRAPGLRLHVDVDRLVRHNAVDWEVMLSEVGALETGRRSFVSLSMAVGLMGTPVPSTVLARLFPGEATWGCLQWLLARNGVIAGNGAKLPRGQAIVLDALLDEHGLGTWARSVAFPSAEWLRERFGEEGAESVWRLHLRRLRSIGSHWRPA